MGTKYTTEAKLRVFATYPVFPAAVLPCILSYFDLDVYILWELVDDVSDCHVQFALRISNVGFHRGWKWCFTLWWYLVHV